MNSSPRARATPQSTHINILLGGVVARMSRQHARDVSRLGVSLAGARLLAMLGDGARVRCSALAMALGLDAPTLSHLLRSLSGRDLIARQRSRDDNRSVEVRLTEEGERVARQCRELEARSLRGVFEGIDKEDIVRLGSILSRMSDNLDHLQSSGEVADGCLEPLRHILPSVA